MALSSHIRFVFQIFLHTFVRNKQPIYKQFTTNEIMWSTNEKD